MGGRNGEEPIKITASLTIPSSELTFAASRSSGPGGQNVNKVSTRVTVLFDVVNSPSLSDRQKALIQGRLPTRINKEGILRVVSQRHRTQNANREEAVERFASLLRESLHEVTARKKRGVSKAARRRRLDEKKHRARVKKTRSKAVSWDE